MMLLMQNKFFVHIENRCSPESESIYQCLIDLSRANPSRDIHMVSLRLLHQVFGNQKSMTRKQSDRLYKAIYKHFNIKL